MDPGLQSLIENDEEEEFDLDLSIRQLELKTQQFRSGSVERGIVDYGFTKQPLGTAFVDYWANENTTLEDEIAMILNDGGYVDPEKEPPVSKMYYAPVLVNVHQKPEDFKRPVKVTDTSAIFNHIPAQKEGDSIAVVGHACKGLSRFSKLDIYCPDEEKEKISPMMKYCKFPTQRQYDTIICPFTFEDADDTQVRKTCDDLDKAMTYWSKTYYIHCLTSSENINSQYRVLSVVKDRLLVQRRDGKIYSHYPRLTGELLALLRETFEVIEIPLEGDMTRHFALYCLRRKTPYRPVLLRTEISEATILPREEFSAGHLLHGFELLRYGKDKWYYAPKLNGIHMKYVKRHHKDTIAFIPYSREPIGKDTIFIFNYHPMFDDVVAIEGERTKDGFTAFDLQMLDKESPFLERLEYLRIFAPSFGWKIQDFRPALGFGKQINELALDRSKGDGIVLVPSTSKFGARNVYYYKPKRTVDVGLSSKFSELLPSEWKDQLSQHQSGEKKYDDNCVECEVDLLPSKDPLKPQIRLTPKQVRWKPGNDDKNIADIMFNDLELCEICDLFVDYTLDYKSVEKLESRLEPLEKLLLDPNFRLQLLSTYPRHLEFHCLSPHNDVLEARLALFLSKAAEIDSLILKDLIRILRQRRDTSKDTAGDKRKHPEKSDGQSDNNPADDLVPPAKRHEPIIYSQEHFSRRAWEIRDAILKEQKSHKYLLRIPRDPK